MMLNMLYGSFAPIKSRKIDDSPAVAMNLADSSHFGIKGL